MAEREHRDDSDLPPGAGWLPQLHLGLGRLAIRAKSLVGGRVTLGVRLAAFDGEGRVLLVRHSYMPGLHLPGGGVEPGETCREAAVREAREEGAVAVAAPPRLVHLYWNRALRRRDHVALFVAYGVRPTGERPAPGEILSAEFYDPRALPEDVSPATRARLAEILDDVPPAELW